MPITVVQEHAAAKVRVARQCTSTFIANCVTQGDVVNNPRAFGRPSVSNQSPLIQTDRQAYHPGQSDYTALILSLISHQNPSVFIHRFVQARLWHTGLGSLGYAVRRASFLRIPSRHQPLGPIQQLRPEAPHRALGSITMGFETPLLIAAKTDHVRRWGHSSFASV